jgi:hypothetical protein
MKLRPLGAVLATALALTSAAATTAAAANLSTHATKGAGKPKVTLTLPASVVEGEKFTLEAKLSRTEGAKQVQLQRADGSAWAVVDKSRARKKKTYKLHDVAGADDQVRYRVKVLYDGGPAAVSPPTQTTVWHWTPIGAFDAYYNSPGINFGTRVHIWLNGVDYPDGWETYGKYGTWESRFTPGRHCTALRGVAGISDDSADGSSAVVSVVSEDTTVVYASPALTPGMAVPFQIAIDAPYRLSMKAARTSQPNAPAYPAIAAAELLCTGLDPV